MIALAPLLAGALGTALPTAATIAIPAAVGAFGLAQGIANGNPLQAITGALSGATGGLGAAIPSITGAMNAVGSGVNAVSSLAQGDPLGALSSGLSGATAGLGDIAKGIGGAFGGATGAAKGLMSGDPSSVLSGIAQGVGGIGQAANANDTFTPDYKAFAGANYDSDSGILNASSPTETFYMPSENNQTILNAVQNKTNYSGAPTKLMDISAPEGNVFLGAPGAGTKKLGTLEKAGNVLSGLATATGGVMSLLNSFKSPSGPSSGRALGGGISAGLPQMNGSQLGGLPTTPMNQGSTQTPNIDLNLGPNNRLLELLGTYRG